MTSQTTPTDAELLQAAGAGDDDAFTQLWERHAGAALRFAHRYAGLADPEDVVQESLTQILAAAAKGRVPNGEFRPYLYRVCRNVAISSGRRKRPAAMGDYEDLEGLTASRSEDPTTASIERSLVVDAFRRLPQSWRDVLWYMVVEGRKPREVGPLLGLTPNATSALIRRANEGLRQEWLAAHLKTVDDPHCQACIAVLPGYVRGRLPEAKRTAVERHLERCPQCTALVGEVGELAGQLRAALLPLLAAPLAMPDGVLDPGESPGGPGEVSAGSDGGQATGSDGGQASGSDGGQATGSDGGAGLDAPDPGPAQPFGSGRRPVRARRWAVAGVGAATLIAVVGLVASTVPWSSDGPDATSRGTSSAAVPPPVEAAVGSPVSARTPAPGLIGPPPGWVPVLPALHGTASPGATVTVLDRDKKAVATLVADDAGAWSYTPPTVTTGSFTFTATQRVDGVLSAPSTAVGPYEVETPGLAGADGATLAVTRTGVGGVGPDEVSLDVVGHPGGSFVLAFDDVDLLGVRVLTAEGTRTIARTNTALGTHDVTLRYVDRATGAQGPKLTVTVQVS